LTVTLAGDGRERHRWEAMAGRGVRGKLPIRFTGWLDGSECASLLQSADLLVVPSLWPEPYGLVGPEAAAAGVPALAFDVGGIREWLTDGVHGRLVPVTGDPAGSLARGLDDSLSDVARLARWGEQARADSLARTLSAHVDALESALATVAGTSAHVIRPPRHEASAALA
jgi:glycosyltransferase involved in cell wall biosynthesis